ncbi:MAG TPA: glycosyltransferase family 4 protein [Planctomycetota bacterium]|nr:glycosyltransferase family 4 protein [Planctomycetota bacterium]
MRDRSITLLNNQGLDQHGGGVRILERLAAHFAGRNTVRIIAETEARDRPFEQRTYPPAPAPRGPSWRWQPLRKVRHLARVVPPLCAGADVVICLDPHFVAAVAEIRPRLCVYVSLSAVPRQEWFSERGATALLRAVMYAWIERRMLKRADLRIVASRFQAREIRRFELLPGFAPLVLPPVFPVPGAVRTSAAEPHMVLVVARLVALKNVERVIELAELTRDLDCRFVIVGDGDRREALERRARPLGDRVHFAGGVEAGPFYREATLLLHMSRYESYGISLVEAMQHGVVPLCGAPGRRCRTATAEIVVDGVSGLWFDLDDLGAAERALRQLLGDPARRAALAAGALARARELLSRDYGGELERVLEGAAR